MLKLTPIGMDRARYFAGGPVGHWHGSAAESLGCVGLVDLDQLRLVLRGAHPADGLRLEGLRSNRTRAGFEVMIAAPKSISLLCTLGGDGRAGIVLRAHQAAALDVIDYLEAHFTFRGPARRRGRQLAVATFVHRRNAAGEPHIHTHAVIANLTPTPDGWRCIDGPSLWRHARAGAALYFVAMDAHLRAHGLALGWEPGPGGTPEVSGVPRAAVVAASSRTAEVLAARAELFRAEVAPSTGNELARRRTHDRRPNAPWPIAVAAAGFDRRQATAVLDLASLAPRSGPTPALDLAVVEEDLLAKGSRFDEADAMEAVARAAPPGTTVAMLERWTAQVCERARPVERQRFLSPHAERSDQRVAAAALERRGGGAGVATTTLEVARSSGPRLDAAAAATLQRLVSAGHGVDVLGPGPLAPGEAPMMAQAAILDAARVAWQAAGYAVAVVPGAGAAARWKALTGLPAVDPREPLSTVVVIDQADRMATPELGALLHMAAREAVKVVLVEGGSVPPALDPAVRPWP